VDDMLAAAPPGGFSPETAVFGILGRPVAHSWSPLLHNMAFRAARLDALYLAFEPRDLETFLGLADDENFRGFSITAPFKQDALGLAKSAEHSARVAGAANTLVRDGDGWLASNSDVSALRDVLLAALEAHRSRGLPAPPIAQTRVLVLGAGGAARAAAQATGELGARLSVSARRADQALSLAQAFGGQAVPWDELGAAEYQILVHCTPAGSLSQPGSLPCEASQLPRGRIVIDANYRPLRTPLLLAAVERNNTAVPGGEWFVRQAAEQFRRFTHQEPDQELLRATFEHAHDAELKDRRG